MSLFGNLKTEGLEDTQDRLGGFAPLPTDVYTGKIKLAYVGHSARGAMFVTLVLDLGGREYREDIYVTTAKGENFYLARDKDGKPTGKKSPLPGFSTVNDICLVTSGKELFEQESEDKMVNVYDRDAKKELPKSVPVMTDLIGQEVSLGIFQTLENKSTKQGDEYVPTAETRTVNSIEKVFHTESRRTVVEARNGQDPTFWDAWQAKNRGNVRDKRTIKDGDTSAPQSGRPGSRGPSAPPQAGGSTAPKKSLFGPKVA